MPYLLSEWRGRILIAEGEYRVAKEALLRLKVQVRANANALHSSLSPHLGQADINLEGTYIIRIFAVFDATLRSYDRYHFDNQDRETKVATMIDQLGALLRVAEPIRAGTHRARRVRNYWAHELDGDPDPMTLERVRGFILSFLDRFPKTWP